MQSVAPPTPCSPRPAIRTTQLRGAHYGNTDESETEGHHHHHHHHGHEHGNHVTGLESELLGGCAFAPSRDPKYTNDIRSGNPGEISTAVIGHPIWGAASPSDSKVRAGKACGTRAECAALPRHRP